MKKFALSFCLLFALVAPVLVRAQKNGASTLFGGTGTSSAIVPPVIDYRLDEGRGQIANNRAYAATSAANLIYPGQGFFETSNFWTKSSITATDNYAADPNGDTQATRLVASATTATLQSGAVLRYEAAPHVLSVWVKSNTGSTQTFRLGYTDGSGTTYSSNLNATTTWARQSLSFTPTATSSGRVIVATDSTPTAIDLVIWGLQLERSGQATTYEQARWDAVLGNSQGVETADPGWTPYGLNYTGDQRATATGRQTLTFSTASVYAVAKFDATVTPTGSVYHPFVSDYYDPTSGPYLMLAHGTGGSVAQGATFVFGRTNLVGTNINLNDGLWHVVCGVYDGSSMRVYVDDALFAYSTGTINSFSIQRLTVGNNGANVGTQAWPGLINAVQIYQQAHNAGQVRTVGETLRRDATQRGITIASRTRVIVNEGDSITAGGSGVGGTQLYTWIGQAAQTPKGSSRMLAIGGSSIASMTERLSTLAFSYKADATLNLLTVKIGTNDLIGVTTAAQFVADLKTYCLAAKAAAPWRIMLILPISRNDSGFETKRSSVTTLILADTSFYDYLIRTDQNTNIGCNLCAANTSYFNVDGVHLNAAGQAELGTLYGNALAAIW